TNDRVVEVGEIERAIRTDGKIDRAKPTVIACHEIRLRLNFWAATAPGELVAMDATGHRIAEKNVVAVVFRKMRRRVVRRTADARRSVAVIDHVGPEAEPIVRLAEA